jgi:hypothetical protein
MSEWMSALPKTVTAGFTDRSFHWINADISKFVLHRMSRLADLRSVVRHALALALLLGSLSATAASAGSLSPEDVHILGKSLAFMQPRPTGVDTVAVVYDAQNTDSLADAGLIAAAIGSGLVTAEAVLRPRIVDSASLGSAEFALAIVATGANGEAVMQAIRPRHVLCVTGDVAAVQAGTCIMAIHSAGRVEILINHQAAESAGVTFATAFRMMVREQ